MSLSIVILNYNTKDLLRDCLESIFKNHKPEITRGEYEVIVVDNASNDESPKMVLNEFPKVKLIINPQNLGFAKGNNRGIKETRGKYILLLNSDTLIEKGTLPVMVKYLEDNPEVGVATCRVELAGGSLDPACHRGFPTPWASLTYFLGLERLFPKSKLFAQYHKSYEDLKTPHEIDSPTGAFYLIRRKVVKEIGMLDEDYFMYGEDLDWSYRIKNAGWKIMFVPQVKIVHFKKQSGRANIDIEERKRTTDYFYQTMKLFYQKHYRLKYPFFINWLMLLGINFKQRLAS